MATKVKKIDMNTKAAKYFVNHHLKGMRKGEAILAAGVKSITNISNIERTETYQQLEKKYASYLQEKIGMAEVAEEHTKNILQDQDKGAKNKAIQMFLDRVEPEALQKEEDDKMIVVLRA